VAVAAKDRVSLFDSEEEEEEDGQSVVPSNDLYIPSEDGLLRPSATVSSENSVPSSGDGAGLVPSGPDVGGHRLRQREVPKDDLSAASLELDDESDPEPTMLEQTLTVVRTPITSPSGPPALASIRTSSGSVRRRLQLGSPGTQSQAWQSSMPCGKAHPAFRVRQGRRRQQQLSLPRMDEEGLAPSCNATDEAAMDGDDIEEVDSEVEDSQGRAQASVAVGRRVVADGGSPSTAQ